MSFKEFYITEMSMGITNRKEGDIFSDEHGNLYVFKELIKSEEGKKYEDLQELEGDLAKTLDDVKSTYGDDVKIIYSNKPKPSNKSYMLLVLVNQKTNKHIAIVRYDNKIMSGQNKWESSSLIMPDLKLKLFTKGGSKSSVQSGLIQVNHLYSDGEKHSSKSILKITGQALEKENRPTQKSILVALNMLMNDIANGGADNYTLKGMKEYLNIFNVSLSEIVIPFALLNVRKGKNKSLFVGTSLKSLADCIGEDVGSFGSLDVLIPTKANERLIDSYIYNGADKLFGISNKAHGGGAAASVTNIIQGLEKVKSDPKEYKELTKKFGKEIQTLQDIYEHSANEGALMAAIEYGVIDEAEKNQVLNAIKNNSIHGISKNIKKMFDSVNSNKQLTGYNFGKHLLTAVAQITAKKINTDGKMVDLIKRILMQANFVQASAQFVAKGNDLVLHGIKLIWPPTVANVKVDANKNFTSTHIRGKLSFTVH